MIEIGGCFGPVSGCGYVPPSNGTLHRLRHCSPATLLPEAIRAFQAKIQAQYTPGGPLNYEPVAYAAKLANFAEAIVCGHTVNWMGGVWGYCNDFINHVAYISYIAKEKNAPKGLGYELHEAFRWFVKGRGMERVRLEVLKTNFHAQEFYRRIGYAQIEEREKSFILEVEC